MSSRNMALFLILLSVLSVFALNKNVPPQYQREFALGQAAFSAAGMAIAGTEMSIGQMTYSHK